MHHNIYSVKYVQVDCCFEAFTLLVLKFPITDLSHPLPNLNDD